MQKKLLEILAAGVMLLASVFLPKGMAIGYTMLNPFGDNTAPTIPTNLTATVRSGTQIDLSWTASTDLDNLTFTYYIYQGEQQLGSTNNITAFSVTGLAPSTPYYFSVNACDAAGNCSNNSSIVSATTQVDSTAPTTPTNFAGTILSTTQINLSWTASVDTDSPNITYHITENNGLSTIANTTSTSYTIKNLQPQSSHSYRIYATDPRGNYSNSSNEVIITLPAVDATAPTATITSPQNNATVSGVTNVAATATDAVGVVGVQFYMDGTKIGNEQLVAPFATSYDFTSYNAGSQHTISAQARDAAGNTSSAQVTVTVAAVQAVPASNVQVSQITTNSAVISWDSNYFIGGTIYYGLGLTYGSQISDVTKAQHHSLTLSNLQSNQTYHFSVIISVPDLASAYSPDATFTTLANNQPVQLAADVTKPTGNFISPAANASVNGLVNVAVSASDPDVAGQTISGIAGVQIKVDNVNLGTEKNSSPYSASWDTSSFSNGNHIISAIIRDAAGNTITINATVVITNVVSTISANPPVNSGNNVTAPGTHPNGTLILDGSTIYLIKNGQKAGFRDAEEYKSHGYNFSQAVAANSTDLSLPSQIIVKALEGTLVIDKSDNRTVYMVGANGTKRGFATAQTFLGLGYKFQDLMKIDMADYPAGPAINSPEEVHPDGALVLEDKTVWWIRGTTRQGFESMAVFNTYGFSVSKIVPANQADLSLAEGPLVKFRDGTLVKDGTNYYIISDGKKLKFSSAELLTGKGYKLSNTIKSGLENYTEGLDLQ